MFGRRGASTRLDREDCGRRFRAGDDMKGRFDGDHGTGGCYPAKPQGLRRKLSPSRAAGRYSRRVWGWPVEYRQE